MEFAYPGAFVGLAVVPLLVAFNLWKYRRLRVRVGSLILWKRLSQHTEAPPASRQRYFNLSLLVQIIAVVLLVSAIAGPRAKRTHTAGRVVHLVIDRSASTQADSAGSRVFERITLGASTLLEHLDSGDRVWCHTFPGTSGLDSSGPLTPAEAQVWLSGLRPTQLSGDPPAAAIEVAARAAGASVFLFTDRRLSGLPSPVHVTVLPADTANVAITAAKAAADSRGLYLFFRIANFAPAPRKVHWEVVGAGGKQYDSSGQDGLTIGPGESAPVNRLLGPGAAGEEVLEIRLLERDTLLLDNCAYVFRNPAAKIQISCIGKQDTRLLRVLSALPGATVVLPEAPTPDCDIAVFNEVSPARLPDCHAVVIAPPAGIPGLVATDRNETFVPQGQLRTEAPDFMPNPNWAQKLTMDRALRPVLRRLRGTSVILASDDVPLIVLFSLEGRKVLYMGFRLSDTRWPQHVSFPLFWGVLTEQMGARGHAAWITRATGSLVHLPARGLSTIRTPSGEQLSPGRSSTRVLLTPESVGIYRAQYPDARKLFGVSLLSEHESKLSDADVPFDPSVLAAARKGAPISDADWLWQYFAFFGALAMLASWLLWHERKKD